MPESEELPPKKDLCREELSEAMLMDRLTGYSLGCSMLGEHWDYEPLFERQPVSQETDRGVRICAWVTCMR